MAGSTYLQDSLSPPCITWWNTTQVCTEDVIMFSYLNVPGEPKKSINQMTPLIECAGGLCCRLTGPCFIKGFSNPRDARHIPTTVRRPTINWKDISRCCRFSIFLPVLKTATGCPSVITSICCNVTVNHLNLIKSIPWWPTRVFCFLQVCDLQEEENWVRQLSGERGVEGDHLLLPANDRRQQPQLGHLREDSGPVSEWREADVQFGLEGVTCPSLYGPGGAGGLRHYNVWSCDTLRRPENWFLCCKRHSEAVWNLNVRETFAPFDHKGFS